MPCFFFYVANVSFSAIHENKILAKISEFIVCKITLIIKGFFVLKRKVSLSNPATFFVLKMSALYIQVHFRPIFFMDASNMNPDQTDSKGEI